MAAHALTIERAREISGPAWLSDRRVAAAERFLAAELPTPAQEEWRYSRIESVEIGNYAIPGRPSDLVIPPAALELSSAFGEFAGRIIVHNGYALHTEVAADVAAKGVRFGSLDDVEADAVPERHTNIMPAAPEGVDPEAEPLALKADPFTDLNLAFATAPIFLSVPRGVTVDKPFQIINLIDADNALVLPQLTIDAGENSEFSIVEWTTSESDAALVVPRIQVSVANAARVRLVTVNALGAKSVQLGESSTIVDQEATFKLSHVALGGGYARNRFDSRLVGRGATGKMTALYLGDEDQMHDLRTFQTHEARDTTSELLFKGALDDRAHAVYTGMIRVDPTGSGTNATQSNRVIKLSENTFAESVPNLEINHNDVRCAHATVVGPIDEDQRFYLESRGVPPEVAERLVVNGFFEEVLETVGMGGVSDRIRPMIAEKLGTQR